MSSKKQQQSKVALSSTALKDMLWDTMNMIKNGQIDSKAACALATQSREILRIVRTQLDIAKYSKSNTPAVLITFMDS